MSAPGRVFVVGLDGATFDLIKPWAAQGYLPTLQRLLQTGAHGALASTMPPMTGPAWSSFATGVNPGKHRLYDWIAREPDSYRFRATTAADCNAPTIYSLLSQVERRVTVLNVPMTFPPTPVNGKLIAGLPAPSMQAQLSYPDDLLDEVIAAIGDYILYPDPGLAYSDSGIDRFLQILYRCTDLRMQALQYLRDRYPADFCMVVFNGSDTISHALWKFMDAGHPLWTAAGAERYGNAIRDYYHYLDSRLGLLVDDLADDETLLVMSDHGFGPFHKFIHVNNWLIDEGLMRIKPQAIARLKHLMFRHGFSPMNVYDWLMRLGMGRLKREVVRGQGQDMLKRLFLSFEDVDWSNSVAYSMGNVGQIYLNVQGREPFGCVAPEDYEQVRDEIIERLRHLRDPVSGVCVVEAVYRREEIYHGEQLEHAPDIVFMPLRMEYFGFGEYEFGSHRIIEQMRRGISGTHRPNGILIAAGNNIRPGVVLDGARLIDCAPTILHLMGVQPPAHIDGRVLGEMLQQPVTAVDDVEHVQLQAQDAALSQAEQKLISERLRGLGYVG